MEARPRSRIGRRESYTEVYELPPHPVFRAEIGILVEPESLAEEVGHEEAGVALVGVSRREISYGLLEPLDARLQPLPSICLPLGSASLCLGTASVSISMPIPGERVADDLRRRKAKIPAEVGFQTKSELAATLAETAARWDIPRPPLLADAAYGDNTALRTGLDAAGLTYVVAISPPVGVFAPETTFRLPKRNGKQGRPPVRYLADQDPMSVRALALTLPESAWRVLPFRRTPAGEDLSSRFLCVRVTAANPVERRSHEPRTEWLIVAWPEGKEAPLNFWLSNLPEDTEPAELARLARLGWMIELDYRQLKGELGLDHYEGRSYAGFHRYCALVTCAHAFLSVERLSPKVPRPD